MAMNEASLNAVESNQLTDAATVASLAILLNSSGERQMHRILAPEVRVRAIKAMTIRAMVTFMVMIIGKPIVRTMPLIPMSSRGIKLVSLKRINQGHLVIMSIGLTRLSQKLSSETIPFKV